MNTDLKLFVARGLPGSGRTTAIERLREQIPGLVFIDADPPGGGEEFANPRSHHKAIMRAAEDIRQLVEHGVKAIAVETCAPRASDVARLIEPAKAAGYQVAPLPPAGAEPESVIYCFEKSSHQPDPDFLAEMISQWEQVDLAPAQSLAVGVHNRAAAWKMFMRAMAANSYDEAQSLMRDLYSAYPTEAADLQVDQGPSWGRMPDENEPSFPLAGISNYWAEIRDGVGSVANAVVRKLREPDMRGREASFGTALGG